MGKWSKLKAKFTRYEHEQSYQEKIDTVKPSFAKLELGELGEEFKRLKNEKWRLEAEAKAVALLLEAVTQIMLERFETSQIESFKLSSGGTITEQLRPFPKFVDEQRFLKWLKRAHPEEQLKFPWASLERIVRERLENGDSIPPGIEVSFKNAVRITGGRDHGEAED